MEEERTSVKVVIVGEAGVGKTSIMQMYSEGTFYKNQSTTVGATCCEKDVTVNKIKYSVSIWDTAGQESYRTIVPLYFRGASIAIVVFDITNRKTLEGVDFWVNTLKENLGNDVVISLCANKMDLEQDRAVDDEEILVASQNHKVPVFYTSAATGVGISSLFEYCLSQLAPESKDDEKVAEEVAIVKVNTDAASVHKSCLC